MQASLFHENWWLSAATGGKFEECVVRQGDEIVGRLPYVIVRRGPFQALRMPPFTHVLGPAVDAGEGKRQTRLQRRLSITRSLIDQLPSHSYFLQYSDPSLDDGLATADGLAFQERRFEVATQYTFEVDCRRSLDELSAGLHLKTRQHVRRAEKQYTVRTVDDPNLFVAFYVHSIRQGGEANTIPFDTFPGLFAETRARHSGVILAAFDHKDEPVAMTYLVWGYGVMYYVLSTRSSKSADSGAVSLLVWHAMKQAHEMRLTFDLDGVYSSGTARFLSNFGGEVKTRLILRNMRMPFRILQYAKWRLRMNESRFYT